MAYDELMKYLNQTGQSKQEEDPLLANSSSEAPIIPDPVSSPASLSDALGINPDDWSGQGEAPGSKDGWSGSVGRAPKLDGQNPDMPLPPAAPGAPDNSIYLSKDDPQVDLNSLNKKSGSGGARSLSGQPSSAPNKLLQMVSQMPSDPYGAGLNDAALAAAQADKSKWANISNLGKAANQILSAQRTDGSKISNDVYDSIEKQGAQGEQDILARRAGKEKELDFGTKKEQADPNSQASALARSLAKRMGELAGMPNLNLGNASAAQIEKQFGPLEKIAAVVETGNTRKEIAEQNRLAKADAAKTKSSEAQQKAYSELGRQVEAIQGGRGVAGQAKQAERKADMMLNTLNLYKQKYGSLDAMPKEIVYRIAEDLDGMYKGGAATVAGTAAAVPDTYVSKGLGLIEKIKNAPVGAKLGKFLEQYGDLATELKKTNKDFYTKEIDKLSKTFKGRLNSDDYNDFRRSNEIDDSSQKSSSQAPKSKPAPGDIITLKNGKRMKVAANGEDLEEVTQ